MRRTVTRPAAVKIATRFSERTYDGNLSLFLERQNVSFVFQKHNALAGKLTRQINKLFLAHGCGNLFLRVPTVCVLKQTKFPLSLEHAAAHGINCLFAHFSFVHELMQVFQISLRAHVNVYSSIGSQFCATFLLVYSVRCHFCNAVIVGYGKTFEAPFLAQHIIYQPFVARSRHEVNNVERRHDTAHTGFDSSLIRKHILVEHPYAAHVYKVIVKTGFHCAVKSIVFQTSGNVSILFHVLPIAVHKRFCYARTKERILAVALGNTSPTGIVSHINHRRISPIDTVSRSLDCRHTRSLTHKRSIPRARLRKGNGKNGTESVNDVKPHEKRNFQSRLVHSHFLKRTNGFRIAHIKNGTDEPLFNIAVKVRLLRNTRCHSVSVGQHKLTDLFIERHFAHQFGNELIF